MRKILVLLLLSILLFSFIPGVLGEAVGVCCNGDQLLTTTGSFATQSSCTAPNKWVDFSKALFLGKTIPEILVAMNNAGQNVCQATTPSQTQAADPRCISDKLSVSNLEASAVSGKREVQLRWVLPCTPTNFKITRNPVWSTGEELVDGSRLSFTDRTELKFGEKYTYTVVVVYPPRTPGGSPELSSSVVKNDVSLGDIECLNRNVGDPFCVSESLYTQFSSDKSTSMSCDANGAVSIDSSKRGEIPSKACERVNKAFSCGANNIIGNSVLACTSSQSCTIKREVVNNNVVRSPACADQSACTTDSLFGLFPSKNECLYTNGNANNNPKSCFFDKSGLIVDKCYSCSQAMKCYDYKSKNACDGASGDWCAVGGVGGCEWHPVTGLSVFGIGVCVEKGADNCAFCGAKRENAPNMEAFNNILDSCTRPVSDALSVSGGQCLFTGSSSSSCASWSCSNYTQITDDYSERKELCIGRNDPTFSFAVLNATNHNTSSSNNSCAIPFCSYDASLNVCFKSSDNDAVKDCSSFTNLDGSPDFQKIAECERDYFPPGMSMSRSTINGNITFLNVFDKRSRMSDEEFVTPQDSTGRVDIAKGILSDVQEALTFCDKKFRDESLFLCVAGVDGSCSSWKETKCSSLYLFNKKLIFGKNPSDGKADALDLSTGLNTINYYAVDWAKNKGVVNSTTLFACEACQGAVLQSFGVSPGKFVTSTDTFANKRWFTNTKRPVLTVSFFDGGDREVYPSVKLVKASISNDSDVPSKKEVVSLPVTDNNLYSFSWDLTSYDLPDGNYSLNLSGVDSLRGVLVTEKDLKFTIDTTPPNLTNKNTIYDNGQSSPNIELKFDEYVSLSNDSKSLEFRGYSGASRSCPVTFSLKENPQFSPSSDNKTWTNNFYVTSGGVNPLDGERKLNVSVTDRAGNNKNFSVNFSVAKQNPLMAVVSPSYCMAESQSVNFVIETLAPAAKCGYYWVNTHQNVSRGGFGDLAKMSRSADGKKNSATFELSKLNGNEPLPRNVPLEIAVACCSTSKVGACDDVKDTTPVAVATQRFSIIFENESPIIVDAKVFPNPATDVRNINQTPMFNVTLTVQTSTETFCKYDPGAAALDIPYQRMRNSFKLINIEPSTIHRENLYVVEDVPRNHFVNIQCLSPTKMLSDPVTINYSTNSSGPLTVTFLQPGSNGFMNSSRPVLSVYSSKLSLCEFSLSGALPMPKKVFSSDKVLAAGIREYAHSEPFSPTTLLEGSYNAQVTCTAISGSSITENASFILDKTPPLISSVIIESSPGTPGKFFDNSRIIVNVSINETGSGVGRMYYQLKNRKGETIVDCAPGVAERKASCIYGQEFNKEWVLEQDHTGKNLELVDGVDYTLTVWAVDRSGLSSNPQGSSASITIDKKVIPLTCKNGVKDPAETGVDCGGSCGGCAANTSCSAGKDCGTGLSCVANLCTAPSCTDGVRNGLESGADCGGSCQNKCGTAVSCNKDGDCDSKAGLSCLRSVCQVPGACENNVIDVGEGDVDCGVVCSKQCSAGKACAVKNDCQGKLFCTSGKCSTSERPPNSGGGVSNKSCDDTNADKSDDCWDVPPPEDDDKTGGGSSSGGKSWIIILFVLVLLGGGGWYAYTMYGQKPKPSRTFTTASSYSTKTRLPLGEMLKGSPSKPSPLPSGLKKPSIIPQRIISRTTPQSKPAPQKVSTLQEPPKSGLFESLRKIGTGTLLKKEAPEKKELKEEKNDEYLVLGEKKKEKKKVSGLSALREAVKK